MVNPKQLVKIARAVRMTFAVGVLFSGVFSVVWGALNKNVVVSVPLNTCDYFCPSFGMFAAVVLLGTLCVQRENILRGACMYPLLFFTLTPVSIVLGLQLALLVEIKWKGMLFFALQSPPFSFPRLWDALTASNKQAISAALKCTLPELDDCPAVPLPAVDCCGTYYQALEANERKLSLVLILGVLPTMIALAISCGGAIFLWRHRRKEQASVYQRLRASASVPANDDYMRLRDQTLDAEDELCRLFHQGPNSQAKREALVAQAEKGNALVARLFKMELISVQDLAKHFVEEDGKEQGFNHLEGKGQPVLPQHANPQGLCMIGEKAQPYFEELMERVRQHSHSRLNMGPVKTLQRISEKIKGLEVDKQPPCAVFDINRATLIAKDVATVMKIGLSLNKFFLPLKMKNKFNTSLNDIKEPPCLFYQMGMRSEHLKEFLQPGELWVVELQITSAGIHFVKEFSHKFYEVSRAPEIPELCVICKKPSAAEGKQPPAEGKQPPVETKQPTE